MQLYETYILSYFKMKRVQKQHKLYSLKSFIASGGLDKIEKCKLGGGPLTWSTSIARPSTQNWLLQRLV